MLDNNPATKSADNNTPVIYRGEEINLYLYTPLYNTIVGVQTNFHVSYPIMRVNCNSYIAKSVGSSNDRCCIQNHVIMNCVIKRLRRTCTIQISLFKNEITCYIHFRSQSYRNLITLN